MDRAQGTGFLIGIDQKIPDRLVKTKTSPLQGEVEAAIRLGI